jgi:hypothetical protein
MGNRRFIPMEAAPRFWSFDRQSQPEELREYNDPSWDVLQVMQYFPAKIPHFFENL